MSKDGQEAQDLRQAEAAEANENALEGTTPTRESYIRELAPTPETLQSEGVQEVRVQVQETTEGKKERGNEQIDKYADLIERVRSIQSLNDLTDIFAHCRRYQLLEVSGTLKRWKVKGLKGNEDSHKLAQAINSKKNRFLREIRDTRREIDKILQQIEYSPDSVQLDKDAYSFHKAGWIEKDFTDGEPPTNWEAFPIKGKQGSKKIAEALNKRRDELIKSEESQERAQLPGNRR